jgi:hypothetical protein
MWRVENVPFPEMGESSISPLLEDDFIKTTIGRKL